MGLDYWFRLPPRLSACPILNQVLIGWHLCLLSHGHEKFRAFLAGKELQLKISLFPVDSTWNSRYIQETGKEMCLLSRHVCAGCGQTSKRLHVGTEWKEWNKGSSHPSTPRWLGGPQRACSIHLSSTPSTRPERPVEHRQVRPSKQTNFPAFPVPLFLIIKAPGITALPNPGKPQRQQLIFFKDVQQDSF